MRITALIFAFVFLLVGCSTYKKVIDYIPLIGSSCKIPHGEFINASDGGNTYRLTFFKDDSFSLIRKSWLPGSAPAIRKHQGEIECDEHTLSLTLFDSKYTADYHRAGINQFGLPENTMILTFTTPPQSTIQWLSGETFYMPSPSVLND